LFDQAWRRGKTAANLKAGSFIAREFTVLSGGSMLLLQKN
jgi:hypothetical protein